MDVQRIRTEPGTQDSNGSLSMVSPNPGCVASPIYCTAMRDSLRASRIHFVAAFDLGRLGADFHGRFHDIVDLYA